MVASFAHAEEQKDQSQTANSSSVKITDVQKKDEQVGDIDNEITNAKMRADSGAKSKWSIKGDITYNGGSLEIPFGPIRPNYAGVAGSDTNTTISGTLAAAYRLTMRDTLRFGAGVNINTPFQNSTSDLTNSNGSRKSSVNTPYVSWGRAFKAWGIQQSLDAEVDYYTIPAYVDNYKMQSAASASWTGIFDIANSNWQPGLSLSLSNVFYKDGENAFDTASNPEDGRSDYSIGLFPFVEYAFNDTLSFRTVFRFLTFDHYRDDAKSTFYHEMWTQSVGIGISVTRDIYLYPNFQFAPEYMRADTTNVGLSTSFSVF